jgi:cob(I)alamin adenosyltransferase
LIDKIEKDLPPLKNFVLPGGSKIAAKLQYSRAHTRRAERHIVSLNKKEKIKPVILIYLNRLSDALFVLAREQNQKVGAKEEIWGGRKG